MPTAPYDGTPVAFVVPGSGPYDPIPVRIVASPTINHRPVYPVDPAIVGPYGFLPVYESTAYDAIPIYSITDPIP